MQLKLEHVTSFGKGGDGDEINNKSGDPDSHTYIQLAMIYDRQQQSILLVLVVEGDSGLVRLFENWMALPNLYVTQVLFA